MTVYMLGDWGHLYCSALQAIKWVYLRFTWSDAKEIQVLKLREKLVVQSGTR